MKPLRPKIWSCYWPVRVHRIVFEASPGILTVSLWPGLELRTVDIGQEIYFAWFFDGRPFSDSTAAPRA